MIMKDTPNSYYGPFLIHISCDAIVKPHNKFSFFVCWERVVYGWFYCVLKNNVEQPFIK